MSSEGIVAAYHDRTKHYYDRFAASLGYLDWSTQPDPFRRYEGAQLHLLPLLDSGRALPYWQIYARGGLAPVQPSATSISLFFRYALSLTAWKQYNGSRWSLRANPSSGNLHPTEGYAILPAIDGLCDHPALYHYAPREHGLERRAEIDPAAWSSLTSELPRGSFLVGISSIHWREAWKYGERAFRYCQHDVGHALGAMRLSAATLGWRLTLLTELGDGRVSSLLGLDRDADYASAEREDPDLVALVIPESPDGSAGRQSGLPEDALRAVEPGSWRGRANKLSREHGVDWPAIEEVARAAWHVGGPSMREDFSGFPSEEEIFGAPVRSGSFSVERVILGRRSAVSMDGTTSIPAETFFRMLARLVPTRDGGSIPWDAIPWRPRIHLGLFVHRVGDLPTGLYALVRDPDKVEALRSVMRRGFLWRKPGSCPQGLHLYLLEEMDCRILAASVSCGQEIAGDGAFSLGMIAEFAGSLAAYGAAFYRNLYWEAGMIGQVLYLEAEEAGIRGTGIGCYFDEAVHEVFGIASSGWQSFYHFTVGGQIEDPRLVTLPPYESLQTKIADVQDEGRAGMIGEQH